MECIRHDTNVNLLGGPLRGWIDPEDVRTKENDTVAGPGIGLEFTVDGVDIVLENRLVFRVLWQYIDISVHVVGFAAR